MKTIILYTIIIMIFNILLLLLPVLIFLLSLSLTNFKIFDLFLQLYIPLTIFSPVLTILLGYKIASLKRGSSRWIIPVLISITGFSPIWVTFLSVSAILSLKDSLLVIFSPILLGLFPSVLVLVVSAIQRKRTSV